MSDSTLSRVEHVHNQYSDADGYLSGASAAEAAEACRAIDPDVADFLAEAAHDMDRPVQVGDVMVSLAWALELRGDYV